MASRSISAILWTLVSVNVLTLVVGGLITWLGYAIPARLTQFGLLPELVIVAGFASLSVACLGLCALNYSSHYALNIYGFSCSIFALVLLLGIPENWYKSSQFVDGALLMNILYFSLLSILLVLLVFALTFAQYLRKKELGLLGPLQQPSSSSSSSPSQAHRSTLDVHERRPIGDGGSARDQLLVDSSCNSLICACNLPLSAQSNSIGPNKNNTTDTSVTNASKASNNNNDNSINSGAKAPTCANNDARAEGWFPWTSIKFGNAATRARNKSNAIQRNTSNNNHLVGELSSAGFIQQPQLQITNGSGNGNGSISSINGCLYHLSDLRVPLYSASSNSNHNAFSNHRPNHITSNNISSSSSGNPCCTRANNNNNNNISSSSSSNAPASILNERTGASLIHKGFYQRIGAANNINGASNNASETGDGDGGLVRAKSFSRPLLAVEGEEDEDELNEDADESDAQNLANANQLPSTIATNYERLHRSASNHCVASQNAESRDDNSIQYGRKQYQTTQRHRRYHHQHQQQQVQQATTAGNNSGMFRRPVIVSTAAALQAGSAWPESVVGSQALSQYTPATLGKCNCYSNSEIKVNRITSPLRDTHSSSSSNARPIINCKHGHHNPHRHRHLHSHHEPHSYQQQQQLFGLQSHNQHRSHNHIQTQQQYTTPRFNNNNSTSTYAITRSANDRPAAQQQSQQKSRSKGSSSVVAMTAAAAAALFGGLTDASSLLAPSEGLGDGGLFAGLNDADAEALLVDQVDGHCLTDSFDMNDHQHLDVTMLNAPATTIQNNHITNDTFQENVLRQPMHGLAPLLEFSRKS